MRTKKNGAGRWRVRPRCGGYEREVKMRRSKKMGRSKRSVPWRRPCGAGLLGCCRFRGRQKGGDMGRDWKQKKGASAGVARSLVRRRPGRKRGGGVVRRYKGVKSPVAPRDVRPLESGVVKKGAGSLSGEICRTFRTVPCGKVVPKGGWAVSQKRAAEHSGRRRAKTPSSKRGGGQSLTRRRKNFS